MIFFQINCSYANLREILAKISFYLPNKNCQCFNNSFVIALSARWKEGLGIGEGGGSGQEGKGGVIWDT